MTDTGEKLRALVLAALMILSVFGGTVALAGTAAANAPGQGSYADNSAPTDRTAPQNATQGSNVEIANFNFTGDEGNVTHVDVDPGYGTESAGITPSDVDSLRVDAYLTDGTVVSVTNSSFSSFNATFNFSATSAATGDQVEGLSVVAEVANSASDGDTFDAGVAIYDEGDGTALVGNSLYDTQNNQTVTSNTGFISGTLTDGGTGNSLPGEKVNVFLDKGSVDDAVDPGDVLVKNVTTNSNGIYTVELAPENVSAGDAGYVLRVDKQGFETFSSDALSVSVGDTTTQNIVLKPQGTPTDIDVIYTEPTSNSAPADGSTTITHYVQVRGTLGTQTNVPLNGTTVDATFDSGTVTIAPATNTTQGAVTLPNGTTVDGVTSFTLTSTTVNTPVLNYSVQNNQSIYTTKPAFFQGESGEGNLHGNLLNIAASEGLENGSVWVVRESDWETNEIETDFLFGANDAPGDPADDGTYWIRLVDNETGEVIDNDDYDLRAESADDTYVRKVDDMNESDSSAGEGYAVIDGDDSDDIDLHHVRLEPRDYYIQVSANASNAAVIDSLKDGTPENFKNVTALSGDDVDAVGGIDPVVFSPTENLTLADAIETSDDTGANLVDSPGFINSFGQDSGGTDADGNYVLSKIPTNFQSGIQYVAIGTKTGYTTDFADVYLTEDGQLEFDEEQRSNDLFVYPEDIEPVVNVTNIALLPSIADAPSDPADPSSYDSYAFDNQTDAYSQVIPRNGEAVDVVMVETTAEEDGSPIDHTVVLSVPDREEGADDEARDFDGSWLDVAGGSIVSQDPANDTITVATGSDGQAIVWLQSDRSTANLNTVDAADYGALACEDGIEVPQFSGIHAASATDAGVVDSTCKVFSGITEFGSISGIVTDQNNNPIAAADVWVQAFELDANDVQVEIDRINDTHANVSVYDDAADAGTLTARGSFVAGADVSWNDLREYRFEDFSPSVRQTYGLLPPSADNAFTLYRQSDGAAGFLGKYTLARVPAKSENNEYSVKARSPVLGLTGSGDAQTRTGVTDDANIVIVGAQAAEFVVSDLSAPENATQGETITVTANVTNNGTVADSANVEFRVDGNVVATTTTEPLSAGETVPVEFQFDTTGVATGTYTHGVFTDDDSQTATLTIEESVNDTGPEVVSGSPAQDLNDDGLYEDVDGDGDFDIVDIQVLFANLDSDAVQNNPSLFDFDESGDISIADVQALFVAFSS